MRQSPLIICKSHYSFLKGVHSIPELVTFAADGGVRVLCLADENGLYGAVEFAAACAEAEIAPLIAAELTDGHRTVTVIVRNQNGYAFLSETITRLQLHGPVLAEVVAPECDDLLYLCDDPVLLQAWVRQGRTRGLHAAAVVSDRARLKSLLSLASRRPDLARQLPAVPTMELNLFSEADVPLYKLLRAVARNCTVASLPAEETVPQTPHRGLLRELPEPPLPFRSALSSSDVADLCSFQFDFDALHLPRFIPQVS